MGLLSSYREHLSPDKDRDTEGFRCVVEIETGSDTEARTQKSATIGPDTAHATPTTKIEDASVEHPFANSLGMRFVQVPIIGGPTDGKRVLFSIWETRVQDYEVFAKDTKHEWSLPNFGQEATHPVVNMSWDDAQAFCTWLTERERKAGRIGADEHYRLPHDHEWSCAVGIGDREDAMKSPAQKNNQIRDLFPWGTAWPPPPGAGNFADESAKIPLNKAEGDYFAGYNDGYAWTAPVASFPANRFGILILPATPTSCLKTSGRWADATAPGAAVPLT